jgi:hypothetical protein
VQRFCKPKVGSSILSAGTSFPIRSHTPFPPSNKVRHRTETKAWFGDSPHEEEARADSPA